MLCPKSEQKPPFLFSFLGECLAVNGFLGLSPQIVHHFIHPKYIPGVEFRHVLGLIISDQAFKGNDGIVGLDLDLPGVDKGVFFQDEANRIGHFIVIILLVRADIESINDIPTAHHTRTPARRL